MGGAFNAGSDFHPIYSLTAASAGEALAAVESQAVDAVVMLGTGMPTLGPILSRGEAPAVPVLSCMSALAWRSIAEFDPAMRQPEAARRYLAGAGWRARFDAAMA